MLRVRITVLIVLAAMVVVVARTGSLMRPASHPQIVGTSHDADDDTPTPGGPAEPTPSPKPAFMPLVFRDPTATRTSTPTATNTQPSTNTPIPTPTSQPTQRPPTAEPTERPCCRCCTRGRSKPCGDTCISDSRNCNTPPGCACFCVLSPETGMEVCNPDEVNELIRRFPALRYDALPELRGMATPAR